MLQPTAITATMDDPRQKVAAALKDELQKAGVALPVPVLIAHGWSAGPGT